jgi:flagellar hook-associated protein 2
LAGIRDAINSASGNPGVRATLVSEGSGSHLVLTSQTTGEAQKIQVSASGGDGGLDQIAYSQSNQTHYTQLKAAQDAIVKVATYQSTSATNNVTSAIDGVSLTLLDSDVGVTKTLTVSYDRSTVTAKINNFVSAYNALKSQITKLSGYNSATKSAGAMMGDSMLTSLDSQLRKMLQDPATGNSRQFSTLANIGITTQVDGTLTVDNAKVQAALNSNLDEVSRLFGGTNGVATRLFAKVEESLKSNSAIDSRTQNLVKQQKVLSDRQASVNSRMETVRAGYVRQFTALDSMLAKMQTTSSYLSQQIDQLASLAKAR